MRDIAPPQNQPTSRTATPATSPSRRWTPGRVIVLALGIAMMLIGAAMLAGAGVLHALDDDRRDGGYLTTEAAALSTRGNALVVKNVDLAGLTGGWLGEVRVRVTSSDPETPLFVGLARTTDVESFLRGVQYSTIDELGDPATRYVAHAGGPPPSEPAASGIWTAQAAGSGPQIMRWTAESGDWAVVVMNSDGSRGVAITADVGATLPLFQRVTWGLLILGIAFLITGAGLAVVAGRRRHA